MKAAALAALVALIPAALNPAPARADSLSVPICTGDGQPREMRLPLRPNGIPGRNDTGPCCAKGCHTGGSRKRGACAN